MSAGEEQLGQILGGRYELRDVIASGGQGFLYRAKDTRDGGDVAIKVLRNASADPDAVERFVREANAMTQLAGTAVVKIFEQVKAGEGATGIVMELLRGRDLKDELEDLESRNERMPREQIFHLFGPIVKTLEAAREGGIVHRDIKPENIFVVHPAYGGGVRLLDFGFARFLNSRRITQEGMVPGSPSHISPEVWMGVQDIDHRADVYSLAVVLFRVLGGKVPFAGANYIELMKAVTKAPRPSLRALRPDLPPSIDDWVQHALSADRDRRFARATAMWNALTVCLAPGDGPG